MNDLSDSAFILDERTGLYVLRRQKIGCEQQDSPAERNEPIENCHPELLSVEVKRDWIPIVMSGLTLVFLVFTVVYARRQWLEANKAANASEVAANAAASAA